MNANALPQPPISPEEHPRQRVRFTYEKGEAIKFISHQDESRLWERTLRRADLPLLYKRGFNPQPHIQFAAPLGLGMTGVRELLDVAFCPPVPLDELSMRIREKLPPGVRLLDASEVPFKTVSPQSLTIGADYTILIYADAGEVSERELEEKIEAFFEKEEVWRERERHGQRYSYNLRPLVLELRYTGYDAPAAEHRIFMRVQMRPGATGRPDELVDALGFDDYARTLRRERIYFSDCEEDQALFTTYPVISQDEISPERPRPRRKGRKRRRRSGAQPKADKQTNQPFAQKAADEFD
ncbi:MAG: TIGR03936 family radical SAM-associated protein [Caldilineaceae bacterium]|nr:TIGR03936 family radical SAM-associated protein [Caldilineaceae bacterium]